MPRPSSVRPSTSSVHADTVNGQCNASLTLPQMQTSEEIKKQLRESLGLPPKLETPPTVPVEGHVCDFPIWSYSKKRSSITSLRIKYDDGSFFELDAPKGMPSPSFPGYLDVILFYGQRDLFIQEYVEISVYSILKTLDIDPGDGRTYEHFRQDMRRTFALSLITDRFRDPISGERSHVDYFRVLRRMRLAKSRQDTSTFYFDDLFLASLRSGYLKRLDWEYCLSLDRDGKPLTRFLYGHLLKRIGEKSVYMRSLPGFLRDIGMGYLTEGEPKRIRESLKRTVYPALDLLTNIDYRLDDFGNLVFIPRD
jgi:hypothetical protein